MKCRALRGGLLACCVALLGGCGTPEEDGGGTPTDPGIGVLVSQSGAGDKALAEIAAQYPIVFCSLREGSGQIELYLMAAEVDGPEVVRLLGGADHHNPRWAPGAASIAFRRLVDGTAAEIGVITPDGQQAVFLTRGEHPGNYAYPPNWSPDGERVSFASLQNDEMRVWAVPRLGGAPARLIEGLDVEHREVAWSPDGMRIAYSAVVGSGRRRDLYVAEARDPSLASNLTEGRAFAPSFIRWSPDGSKIAFSSAAVLDDGNPEPGGASEDGTYVAPDDELFVIDVESKELTRLTDNADIDLAPAWSPDGTRLLFTSDRDGDGDLWLLTLGSDAEPQNLIDDEADPTDDLLADWYWGAP